MIAVLALMSLMPSGAAAQGAPADDEVAPGVAEQQARYDAHETEAAPRRVRALRGEPKLREPITLLARRLRIATGYTFVGLGVLSLVVGLSVSAGSYMPWLGATIGGSIAAGFIFGIGLPVLIAGYARRHVPAHVAVHLGPGQLQLSGAF